MGALGAVAGWQKWNTARPDHDDAMRAHLDGMLHPVTGAPLQIKHIELPPGSMVCIPAHMPHYVAPRSTWAGVRWGLLLTYRQPDPQRRFRSISRSIPDQWVERTLRGRRQEIFAEW
jgi:hypothetical protein